MSFPDFAPEMESFFSTCSQDWNGIFFSALILEKNVCGGQKNTCQARSRHAITHFCLNPYYFPNLISDSFPRRPGLRAKPSLVIPYAIDSLNSLVNRDDFRRRFHLRGFITAALITAIICRMIPLTSTKYLRRSFSL